MAEKPCLTCIEKAKQIAENQKRRLTIEEILPKLEEEKQTSQKGPPKIRKVAPYLRERENFTKHCSPKLVSMGPIHHGQKNLKLGEQYKRRWAANYLHRTKPTRDIQQALYNKIAEKIEELKDLFTEDAIEGFTNDEELSAMLFVDGCSLLEILDKASRHRNLGGLHIKLDQLLLVMQDLLLLENQIPYKVLKWLSSDENDASLIESMSKLLGFYPLLAVDKQEDGAKENNQQQEQIVDIHPLDPTKVSTQQQGHKPANLLVQAAHHLRRLCRNILRRSDPLAVDKKGDIAKENNQQQEPPVHLLDLMHRTILPEKPKDQEHQEHKLANLLVQATQHLQCLLRTILCQSDPQKAKEQGQNQKESDRGNVTHRNIRELKAAGIRVKESKSRKLTDISFYSGWFGGELKLPKLDVDDATAPIFLNLIAYEMCPDFHNDYGISTFVTFLDSLIDYPDDVKELRRAGVLINCLGSDEEVAQLFNAISTDLVPDFRMLPYSDVRPAIEKHYRNKWMTWLTLGYHKYFSNPWSIIAFLAALIILVLTVIQTAYAVL